jgi:hypothetical protein
MQNSSIMKNAVITTLTITLTTLFAIISTGVQPIAVKIITPATQGTTVMIERKLKVYMQLQANHTMQISSRSPHQGITSDELEYSKQM